MLTNRGEENLPRPLRDFLNDASCEWSISHVAGMARLEQAGFMPSGWALRAMRLEDDTWRAAAYRQRGIGDVDHLTGTFYGVR